MSASVSFMAVDLGASSGRVMDCRWDGDRFSLDEAHRFPNAGVRVGTDLYWDVLRIWTEIQNGLRKWNALHDEQETTFVIPREPRVEDKEGIRVRIFLPTKEVPFAGHPSLGTAMALQALWKQRNLPLRKVVRLALNVGQVPVTFRQEADGLLYGEMEQPDPQFSSA